MCICSRERIIDYLLMNKLVMEPSDCIMLANISALMLFIGSEISSIELYWIEDLSMSTTRIVNGVYLTLQEGDITKVQAEAIVNAANAALAGGGGVDGAIHRAAGPGLIAECRKIGGCPTGSAVATSAGRLSAKYIFHAVGPIYQNKSEDEHLLCSAYRNCLDLAEKHQIGSIVFPSLSTGAYGYPLALAAPLALQTVIEHLYKPTSLHIVTFALFGSQSYQIFAETLDKLLSTI
jgi:O-acetyl-ADP-ribose deacetylase (regulator of RNase III)